MKRLLVFLSCLGTALSALAVDREAFTITRYQLEVEVDRTTHVMAVTGKLTLRNDSNQPQKLATLQVSSSLAWNAIALEGQPLQWLGDNYTSDVDHTGSLSEAIITLPKEAAPATTVTLDVQYGGTVTQDATRLTRMGVPADVAARNDWDEISDSFTAVRGLGYVVWYPVAIEAVSLSDGNALFDSIARWKQRHERSGFEATFAMELGGAQALRIVTDIPDAGEGKLVPEVHVDKTISYRLVATAPLPELGDVVPTFAIANYVELARPAITLLHIPDHTSQARDYALAAEANDPLLNEWLPKPGGAPSPRSGSGQAVSPQPTGWAPSLARVVELTDPNANPWQNGAMLFTPLREAPTATLQLLLLPTQIAARFHSPRAWIQSGLERFLQVKSVENRSGRRAALEYLDQYREPLAQAEALAHPKATTTANAHADDSSAANNALLNTNDEVYLRGKGGFVFWMLRDMVDDEALQHAIAAYRGGADKEPTYFQRLLEASSKDKLEWFFDDWVYRDRGLPDFHVESVYPRLLLSETEKHYMVTATIENRGHAGAEVPVILQTPSGEKSVRVLVRAGEKGVGRIEVPVPPAKIVINDGSVPDANTGSNVYDVPPPQQ